MRHRDRTLEVLVPDGAIGGFFFVPGCAPF
jgi:hypothetical protein